MANHDFVTETHKRIMLDALKFMYTEFKKSNITNVRAAIALHEIPHHLALVEGDGCDFLCKQKDGTFACSDVPCSH
jgi:hypothetical protein